MKESLTSVSRTLVDLAGDVERKLLRWTIEQAAVAGLLDVAGVDRVLAGGRRCGAPELRKILAVWREEDERSPKLRSGIEARLLTAAVEAGLSRPRCNAVLWIGNERLEVDLLWEDERLVIETDGVQTHGTRAAFRRDRRRDQVLTAAGYRVARVTWGQLESEPAAVVARIGRMLSESSRGGRVMRVAGAVEGLHEGWIWFRCSLCAGGGRCEHRKGA